MRFLSSSSFLMRWCDGASAPSTDGPPLLINKVIAHMHSHTKEQRPGLCFTAAFLMIRWSVNLNELLVSEGVD